MALAGEARDLGQAARNHLAPGSVCNREDELRIAKAENAELQQEVEALRQDCPPFPPYTNGIPMLTVPEPHSKHHSNWDCCRPDQ